MHSLMHQTQCSAVSHNLLTFDTHQRRGALHLILCAFPFPSLTNGASRQSSACPALPGFGNVSQLRHRHVISLSFQLHSGLPGTTGVQIGSFPRTNSAGHLTINSFQLCLRQMRRLSRSGTCNQTPAGCSSMQRIVMAGQHPLKLNLTSYPRRSWLSMPK